MKTISNELVKNWLPKREPDAHKGDFGRVLVIAGSEGMMGACVLACRAAFRSGSGLVAASCDPALFPVVHACIPEATCVSRENIPLARYDAIAVGPGLGVNRDNYDLICRILQSYEGPVVLDADGLNCLSEYGVPSSTLITAKPVISPHAGEAARLVKAGGEDGTEGVTPAEISEDRAFYGKFLAKRLRAVCMMKGRGSLVCLPDGTVYENTTGNAGMATGGSGDVLTGITASLAGQYAAQGVLPQNAAVLSAVCGVFLHGLAGDLAAAHWGESGVMASDLADFAALAWKHIDKK